VQAAREAARQAQCKNNLKQLALGCLGHENLTKRFPTNGWGFDWTGDADRGNDWRQPAGWIYNILPFIEQQAMHDMGAGLPQTQKYAANLQRMSIPLSVLYCPTRRQAIAYPWDPGSGAGGAPVINAGMPTVVGRTDYAANGGDVYVIASVPGSNPYTPAWSYSVNDEGGPISVTQVENPEWTMTPAARVTFNAVAGYCTGVMFVGSMVKIADITDGTSCTCLVGEKYLDPDSYADGVDIGDNEDAMMGDNQDISRWYYPPPDMPLCDTPGYSYNVEFGSAHINGFQMSFCDGAVTMLNYSMDAETFRRLINRRDGLPIQGKKW
jgi:hypothetical protein